MKLIWFGSRTWEMECFLPWIPFDYYVSLESSNYTVPGITWEWMLGKRHAWGSGELSEASFHEVLIKAIEYVGFDANIISYQPFLEGQSCPHRAVWRIDPNLARFLADKWLVRHWLQKANLPVVPCTIVSSNRFPSGSRKAVLQALLGSCGLSTYIGPIDVLKKAFKKLGWRKALLSPYIPGWVINGHVAVFKDGRIEIPSPSIQLVACVDDDECTRPLYAGNDFRSYDNFIAKAVRNQVQKSLFSLGQHAKNIGYYGLLGADLLFDPIEHRLMFLEINARLQGSTGLLSLLEMSSGRIPTAVRVFADLSPGLLACTFPHKRNHNLVGNPVSQIVIRKNVPMPQEFLCSGRTFGVPREGVEVQPFAAQGRILLETSAFMSYGNPGRPYDLGAPRQVLDPASNIEGRLNESRNMSNM